MACTLLSVSRGEVAFKVSVLSWLEPVSIRMPFLAILSVELSGS